jgi:hypothetical protein
MNHISLFDERLNAIKEYGSSEDPYYLLNDLQIYFNLEMNMDYLNKDNYKILDGHTYLNRYGTYMFLLEDDIPDKIRGRVALRLVSGEKKYLDALKK